jgi:hypothetical protein
MRSISPDILKPFDTDLEKRWFLSLSAPRSFGMLRCVCTGQPLHPLDDRREETRRMVNSSPAQFLSFGAPLQDTECPNLGRLPVDTAIAFRMPGAERRGYLWCNGVNVMSLSRRKSTTKSL